MHRLKWVAITLALCLTTFAVSAQETKLDSLYRVLRTAKEDTNKVRILNGISIKLWNTGNYDSALTYANRALTLGEKLDNKNGMAAAYRSIGIIYRNLGNYKGALDNDQKALDLNKAAGYKAGVAANLGNIGSVYHEMGNLQKAKEYIEQALQMHIELHDKGGIATNYANLGDLSESFGNSPEALDYFFKALDLSKQLNDKNMNETILGNIGNVYEILEDRTKALHYYNEALTESNELGDKGGMATNLCNIGNVYHEKGNNDSSMYFYTRAADIFREIGQQNGLAVTFSNIGYQYQLLANSATKEHKQSEADSLLKIAMNDVTQSLEICRKIGYTEVIPADLDNLATIYTTQKKYDLAARDYNEALKIENELQEKEIFRNIYGHKASYDSAIGDYKAAYYDFMLYTVYSDSLKNEETTRKSVQSEMDYQFKQKQEAEKAAQDKKDLAAEQERKRDLLIRYFLIGGSVLLLGFVFFVLRSYNQKRKDNITITHQKELVEEKQKEILDSIHYAQRIQKAMLASDELLKKNLNEYFVLYKPKDIVSGDFYWATQKNGVFYLAVCDSTGHGVPGAFMSLLNISFLNEAITEKGIAQPNEVFNHARKRLIENISQEGQQDGMDGVLLHLSGLNMQYAGAYNAPVVIRENKVIELEADKIPVGKSPRETETFTHHTEELQKGDMVYLYTDGYADQFGGPKGKKFKHSQLLELLLAISGASMTEQKQKLESTLNDWKSQLEQVDDILIVGIRV